MSAYAHIHLDDLDDFAANFGLGGFQEVRFAGEAVDLKDAGFALVRVLPGQRPPFAHRHEKADEVYVVISGSGRIKVDDDIVELKRLDAIRVDAPATRAFEAGPDGLELLALGARHDGDGEVVRDFWVD